MSHVFISYARDDMKAEDGKLQRLVRRLRHNFNIWFDQTDIVGGTNWKEALQKAVKASKVVVFLMSQKSVTSEWCEAELDTAKHAHIPIIPYVYQEADFSFGLSSSNAIFDKDPDGLKKLDEAILHHAPETSIHHPSVLVDKKLLHQRDVHFKEVRDQVSNPLNFVVNIDQHDIDLVGLPLATTTFCTSYLFGQAEDTLAWTKRIQLALQFSGDYRSSAFLIPIAKHFLSQYGQDFPLRILVVFGPPKISYNQREKTYMVNHELEIPSAGENQWNDAVSAVQQSLRIYHQNREAPDLQIFAQGPLAGIGYELGSAHRGLHYRAEHYHYDRDTRTYHRVLGELD